MQVKPIDLELVNEYLQYDDGVLTWKKSPSGKAKVGKLAGTLDRYGYRVIRLKGNQWKAHRIVWTMFHGDCPDILDHINGNKDDNRLENLREADVQLNALNRDCSNPTGHRWVNKTPTGKYNVCRKIKGVAQYYGTYEKLEDAAAVSKQIIVDNFPGVYRR